MNILDWQTRKKSKQKISMLTCYDFWSASLLNKTNVDCLLVGDSLAMVMHGYKNTLFATTELMRIHCLAVKKGAPDKFVIGDLPFLSYRKSLALNMKTIERIMQTGVEAVKLEGAAGNLKLIQHIVESGVPVMGHLGLTPQLINTLGGFKVQGKTIEAQKLLIEQARGLSEAGCFALVLECVPSQVAEQITALLDIPVIGIGAGAQVDGQVLVLQDMLGLNDGFKPKFLKNYLAGAELVKKAVNQYHEEVQKMVFPSERESYS